MKTKARKDSKISIKKEQVQRQEEEKMIDISSDAWAKTDFFEDNKTDDLVRDNYQESRNGQTKMKHNIKYAKNGQVINVIFDSEKHKQAVDSDALVIKFARKTVSQGNIVKLQASKQLAAKIVSNNLLD